MTNCPLKNEKRDWIIFFVLFILSLSFFHLPHPSISFFLCQRRLVAAGCWRLLLTLGGPRRSDEEVVEGDKEREEDERERKE